MYNSKLRRKMPNENKRKNVFFYKSCETPIRVKSEIEKRYK